MDSTTKLFAQVSAPFEKYIETYIKELKFPQHASVTQLKAAMAYSLAGGGKRFRPALCLFTAQALNSSASDILPFAAAVECIHTYSLIHDDLPCMDNDDERRGKPTNHKVYGEAMALLAGDALLTEAFQILAQSYSQHPALAKVILELATAAGPRGMVGGQAIDLNAQSQGLKDNHELTLLHSLKTGALIHISVVGAAHFCNANGNQLNDLSIYATHLGEAFQLADDLLDYNPENCEPGSYPALFGYEKSRELLQYLTKKSLNAILSWDKKAESLRLLAQFNQERTH